MVQTDGIWDSADLWDMGRCRLMGPISLHRPISHKYALYIRRCRLMGYGMVQTDRYGMVQTDRYGMV